jgi:hypothetical protein
MKTVTEELLSQTSTKYYGAGRQLEVGDEITYGFTNNPIGLNVKLPDEAALDGMIPSFSLKLFVNKDGVLYELYSKK